MMKVHVETTLSFDVNVDAEELVMSDKKMEEFVNDLIDEVVQVELGEYYLSEPKITQEVAA